jgi:GT2 family glycosyltransferase
MIVEAALQKSLLVIPSINGASSLEQMLPTLGIPGERVVVLDQGSTDNTGEVCRKAGVGLLQLAQPRTYAEACNVGAEMANERGCDFVFIANNDIRFATDVMRELLAELLRDPRLGIVAPAQMLIDQAASVEKLAYRVNWDPKAHAFARDFTPPADNTHRLEADFCELTFAGVSMAAIHEIGFLDNGQRQYCVDADFGSRLRDAGYTCAYLPNSRIELGTKEAGKLRSTASLASHHAAPTVSPFLREGVVARTTRRVDALFNLFADQLKHQGLEHAIRASWSQFVGPFVRTRTQWLKWKIIGVVAPARRVHPRASRLAAVAAAQGLRQGALFIGYAEGALGLGQAFRANLDGAEAADIPFAVYPFRGGIETRLTAPYMQHRYDKGHAYKVNVIQVAPDWVPRVFNTLGAKLTARSYNILCTYWELPEAPKEWRAHLANIDEIWAPNKFIADAFAHIFAGPIVIMPPAMEATGEDHLGRAHFGLDEGRFYFTFSFDYFSSPFRKNPLGVLDAFQRAFPNGDENVGLVIKSTGAPDHYPDIKAVIADAMAHDARIRNFDRNMPREEVLGLIRASDAYVSLHRAEGFGLGMAEAMTFGRIVIGTGYSGCTDFLTDETGYPVPYTLRPLEAHEYPWSRGQHWAEPDQDAAVKIMRQVAANPTEGMQRGERAREYVLHRYNPAVVGAAMRERLNVLFGKGETGQTR